MVGPMLAAVPCLGYTLFSERFLHNVLNLMSHESLFEIHVCLPLARLSESQSE